MRHPWYSLPHDPNCSHPISWRGVREGQSHISKGINGLSNALLGPAMPYHYVLQVAIPETALRLFSFQFFFQLLGQSLPLQARSERDKAAHGEEKENLGYSYRKCQGLALFIFLLSCYHEFLYFVLVFCLYSILGQAVFQGCLLQEVLVDVGCTCDDLFHSQSLHKISKVLKILNSRIS